MDSGDQVTGYQVVAKALAAQGLTHVFGIVGIPVIELGTAFQTVDMNYFGFRNEQAASYAAGIVGYLTKKPGVCLVVSGPGMTNTISGMAEALVNKRPLIVLGGASDSSLEGQGGFQELDQVSCAKPVCKYAARPSSIQHIPVVVERAVRMATYGTPGPCYIDLPHNLLYGKVDESLVQYLPKVEPLPQMILPAQMVTQTIDLLKQAQSPLIIVGKGIAYAGAHDEMRQFVDTTKIPFLATPMGKGVISDYSELSAARARSYVLQNADVIFLCGARLNWILHFGLPPRFRKDVKIIQLDSDPLEMNTNVKSALSLCGDAKVILEQLNEELRSKPFSQGQANISKWTGAIKAKSDKNAQVSLELAQDQTLPMNYYTSIGIVQDEIAKLGENYIIVSEGSNTMDIGRTILQNNRPLQRLDAGTFGTMGVGFGFAIAAQHLYPDKKVVMVVGDSAFGFSGMELETAARYRLPLKVVVINNNGIVMGAEEIDKDSTPKDISVLSLSPWAKYEQVAIALGGKGRAVNNHADLRAAMREMLADNDMWVINCSINPTAGKKAQSFTWLTTSDEKKPAPKL